VELAVAEVIPAACSCGLTSQDPLASARETLRIRFAGIAAAVSAERADELNDVDIELAAGIAADAVALITCAAAVDRRPALEDGTFAREMGRLVARYLARGSA